MFKHETRNSTSGFLTRTNKKLCTEAIEPLKPGSNSGLSRATTQTYSAQRSTETLKGWVLEGENIWDQSLKSHTQ